MISKVKRKFNHKRKHSRYPGQPFSELLTDATFGNTSVIFSTIHIVCIFCTHYVQRALKSGKFTKRNVHIYSWTNSIYNGFKLLLLPVFLFGCPSSVHVIHGINHALIKITSSSNQFNQHQHVDTIITNLNKQTNTSELDGFVNSTPHIMTTS